MDNKQAFQQNLIKELGLDALAPEKQQEILESVGRIIFQAIMMRVMGLLTDEDKDEFEKLLGEDTKDENAVFDFLRHKVMNLDQIANEEVANFKAESADLLKQLAQ